MTSRAVPPSRSFEDTYLALYELAYRTSYRLTGSADLAADVAQGSLVRVYEKWRRVHTYAEPWTVRVAGNLTFDELRKQNRHRSIESSPAQSTFTAFSPANDERAELVELLRSLPKRQREVVVLRYIGDLTESDVASSLGCSLGTVKQHASRGLEALRQALPALSSPLEKFMFEHLDDPTPRPAPDTLLTNVVSSARRRSQRRMAVVGAACMLGFLGVFGAASAMSSDQSRQRLVTATPAKETTTSGPTTIVAPATTVVTVPSVVTAPPVTSPPRRQTTPPATTTTLAPLRGDTVVGCGTLEESDAYVIEEPTEQQRAVLDCIIGGFARNNDDPNDPTIFQVTERMQQVNGIVTTTTYSAGYQIVRVARQDMDGEIHTTYCRKIFIASKRHIGTDECTDQAR